MYLWEIFYWSWSLTKIGSLQSTTWTSPWTVLCVSITLLHHSPCAVCTNFSPSLDILSRDLPLSQITFSHWTLSINSLSHITSADNSADNILLTQANFLQKMWFEAENHATHLGQWRNVQLQISCGRHVPYLFWHFRVSHRNWLFCYFLQSLSLMSLKFGHWS